jgi:hypothetical protein
LVGDLVKVEMVSVTCRHLKCKIKKEKKRKKKKGTKKITYYLLKSGSAPAIQGAGIHDYRHGIFLSDEASNMHRLLESSTMGTT